MESLAFSQIRLQEYTPVIIYLFSGLAQALDKTSNLQKLSGCASSSDNRGNRFTFRSFSLTKT
jgi:hypothetical protein